MDCLWLVDPLPVPDAPNGTAEFWRWASRVKLDARKEATVEPDVYILPTPICFDCGADKDVRHSTIDEEGEGRWHCTPCLRWREARLRTFDPRRIQTIEDEEQCRLEDAQVTR